MKVAKWLAVCTALAIPAAAGAGEITNGQWVVPSSGAQTESFTATRPTALTASVSGVKNTDKGFRVRLVNAEDVNSCRVTGGTCRELAEWRQPRTTAFTHSGTVPAGRWAFMVENSENIFRAMTVSVVLSTN